MKTPRETLEAAHDMRSGLILLRSEIATLCEHAALMMKAKRAAYEAALAEGFNEQQALELAKAFMS